jgi:hypothetical protein
LEGLQYTKRSRETEHRGPLCGTGFPGRSPEKPQGKKVKTVTKAAKRGKFVRNRQQKWDKKHLRTVSTKVSQAEYEEIRACCKARATTPYAVLQDFLRGWF